MGNISVMMQSRNGRQFMRLAEDLPVLVEEAIQGLAADSEIIFQAHAPKGTDTRLARGIRVQTLGSLTAEVVSTARNPVSGYAYTGVTRFGHRRLYIEPKRAISGRAGRAPSSVISTRNKRSQGRRAALRFIIGGRIFYRARIKSFQPAVDWASQAMPQVHAEAKRATQTLGQRIIARLF